ncbi:MAG TPA: GNAT family N-acetyltransferase [Nannocystaceae bacterium]|nr:GNAT family N-acetyltransferase [Nannocystaceae bacterium]
MHVESSNDAYAPLAAEWPEPDRAERAQSWREWIAGSDRVDLVAEVDGAIVGFISGGRNRVEGVEAALEIYVIHVLPAHRGRDVGGQLWARACALLRGPELRSLVVDTFAELRCCRFYERRGGQVATRSAGRFHGGAVTDVVYRWPDGVASLPAEDP